MGVWTWTYLYYNDWSRYLDWLFFSSWVQKQWQTQLSLTCSVQLKRLIFIPIVHALDSTIQWRAIDCQCVFFFFRIVQRWERWHTCPDMPICAPGTAFNLTLFSTSPYVNRLSFAGISRSVGLQTVPGSNPPHWLNFLVKSFVVHSWLGLVALPSIPTPTPTHPASLPPLMKHPRGSRRCPSLCGILQVVIVSR